MTWDDSMNRQRAIVFSALIALSGCATTMNENECKISDWREVGYVDGTRGMLPDHIATYRKECADYQVTPDLQAYNEGRQEGLTFYCRPQRGYELGAKGRRYQGVCPSELEGDFLYAYRAGRTFYDLKARLKETDKQLARKRHELSRLRTALTDKGTLLIGEGLSIHDRAQLVIQTHEIVTRIGELDKQVAVLERRKTVREAELAQYRATSTDEFH